MNLFQTGAFTLHSGQTSTFKIDCDALTDEDLATVAEQLVLYLRPFSWVRGVPEGGLRLAKAMEAYTTAHAGWLVVDDVWTTGSSLYQAYRQLHEDHGHEWIGHEWIMDSSPLVQTAVIFARTPTPEWCTALFTLNPGPFRL